MHSGFRGERYGYERLRVLRHSPSPPSEETRNQQHREQRSPGPAPRDGARVTWGAVASPLWRTSLRRSTTSSRIDWYRSAGSFSSAFSTAMRSPTRNLWP